MPNKKYLESLSAAQRKALDKLETLLDEPDGTIKWRLRVGQLVERLVPRGISEEYRRKCMTNLLEQLGRKPHFQAELYAARQVAACYPNLDVAKLQGRQGFQLRWCHLRWLAAVDDPKHRKELQQECLKKRWSCLRLSREIQKEFGTRGRGGRKFKKRQKFGPAVSLREMTRLAKRWAICHSSWLDKHGKRLAGSLSAARAEELQPDLEAAAEHLAKVNKLVPTALKAVQSHLAELKAKSAAKKPAKRPRRKSAS